MTRVNLVLALALVLSALHLVRQQHEGRRLYAELDRAHSQAQRLKLERERLQVDISRQAANLRVERLARERLSMRSATPAISIYVRLPSSLAQPAQGGQP